MVGGHAWRGAYMVEECMCGKGGMHGRGAVRGIRSMSGRYTSHWNAFLLFIKFDKTKGCGV